MQAVQLVSVPLQAEHGEVHALHFVSFWKVPTGQAEAQVKSPSKYIPVEHFEQLVADPSQAAQGLVQGEHFPSINKEPSTQPLEQVLPFSV
jgi:hypothetical protein